MVSRVGLAGRFAEREETMVEQHHPDRSGIDLIGPRGCHRPGKVEAGHYIGNDDHGITEDLLDVLAGVTDIG